MQCLISFNIVLCYYPMHSYQLCVRYCFVSEGKRLQENVFCACYFEDLEELRLECLCSQSLQKVIFRGTGATAQGFLEIQESMS